MVFTTPDSAVPVLVSLFEITLVPYDRCTPGRGVEPDVAVVYDEAAFADGRDPYLDALSLELAIDEPGTISSPKRSPAE